MLVDLGASAGAFLQELVPFPSWLVFMPAGATLEAQHAGLWHVAVLALAIGVFRVLAGLVVYALSESLYVFLYTKRKSWLGIRKTQVDRLRKKLGAGGGWWTIFIMWALPIVPSTLIPLSAGFVTIPLRTFVTATYAGSIINAFTYLLIGYYGIEGAVWLFNW